MPQHTNRTTVVGVFNERDKAERAIDELHRIGFRDDQIGFAWKGQGSSASTSRGEVAGGETSDKVGGGLATGAVVGGIIGAAAALLIPGIGPVIAGGILAPLLGVGATAAGVAAAGALAGAAAGSLVGALAGLGIPEEEARYYENEFNQGRTLVTVKADNRYDEVSAILRRHGAYDIEGQGGLHQHNVTDTDPNRTTSTARPTTGTGNMAGTDSNQTHIASTPHNVENEQARRPMTGSARETELNREGEMRMSVTEEELIARKKAEQVGEVQVRKEVVEERKDINVPVSREEVHVERTTVNRDLRPGEESFTEGTIRVPIIEEQVVVEKRPRVVGEVVISKEQTTEQKTVSGTVRREEVHVDRDTTTNRQPMTGGTTSDWSSVSSRYRTNWQDRYGRSGGGSWEDVEPVYRYGYESYNNPRYQGRSFTEVEPNLRRDWEARGQTGEYSTWDRVKDFFRDIWDGDRR